MTEITKAEMRQKLGNIDQLKELLFGEQLAEYEAKIGHQSQIIKQLEIDAYNYQERTNQRLEQLENKLKQRIATVSNSTEKKIQYLSENNREERQKLDSAIKEVAKHSSSSFDSLQNNIKTNHSSLKLTVTELEAATNKGLQTLKQQLLEKLESSLAQLGTEKLNRQDLAEVLFELCLQLKEPQTMPELTLDPETTATEDNANNDNLLLTEQS